MRPFQGRVQTRRGQYCYPLTPTKHASRYLLLCKALTSTREDLVVTAFEQLFQERGPPHATRAGNGVPFASPNAPSTFPSSRYGGSGAASPSPRPYTGLPDLTYPSTTTRSSSPPRPHRIHRKPVNISTVLAGQRLGIREVDDGIWIVSFMHYDLGFIDLQQKTTLQPSDNPLGPRMSPTS
jgi:hypothetical protein